MKVYLASSFDLIVNVNLICDALERRGHSITSKWWLLGDHKEDDVSDYNWYKKIEDIYFKALNGIESADIVILVCPYDRTKKFNGANVEVGYALAKNKPVFSIGQLERSGMYHKVMKCSCLEDLMEAIGK